MSSAAAAASSPSAVGYHGHDHLPLPSSSTGAPCSTAAAFAAAAAPHHAGWSTAGTAVPDSEWMPPHQKVSGTRNCDFVRFADLQAALKRSCSSLLHFVKRDFEKLAAEAPRHEGLCTELVATGLAESISKFGHRAESLARRVREGEKLRVVFIGPLNAGKSTLINVLLTAGLEECDVLLPVDNVAATSCVWKVESCDGFVASVWLDDELLKSWTQSQDWAGVRQEMAKFLEEHLGRNALPQNRSEITVQLPLAMLDPFGCPYCLVDTPGYTENEEYEQLVMKYLQDHSHIACFVCPLTEGAAVPQSTRNMMNRSYSKAFWVLTRFDACMMSLRAPKGQSQMRRQSADKVASKFYEQIRSIDPNAYIFKHAAQLLMPDDTLPVFEKHLSVQDARGWFQQIRSHVKDCFLEIQQEKHVLGTQSRQCIDIASDVLQEYASLNDSSQGTMAASEYYWKELQIGADEAADLLDREIRQEIDIVKGPELDRLRAEVATQLKTSKYMCQQTYCNDFLSALVPRVETELQTRLTTVIERAQGRVLELATRLLQEAQIVGNSRMPASNHQVFSPGSGHLQSRYPVESLATLTVASSLAGAAALSEGGAALLLGMGLRLGAMSVAGLVGAAVMTFATLGYTIKKASEIQPFWAYDSIEMDTVEKLRNRTQWGILAEASSSRSHSQLLSSVSHFRYAFSRVLLVRGTPREALVSIFPDLPLFEQIHAELESTCKDIREFMDPPDLAVKAESDMRLCLSRMHMCAWRDIIDISEVYMSPNSRTDAIDGSVLARICRMRCEALVQSDVFGEAVYTANKFHQTFPQLVLPHIYEVATQVRFDSLAGTLDHVLTLPRVQLCSEQLTRLQGTGEVPPLVEIWFHGVVASFVGGEASLHHMQFLKATIDCFIAAQMKSRPSWTQICHDLTGGLRSRVAAIHKELGGDLLQWLSHLAMSKGPEDVPDGVEKLAAADEAIKVVDEAIKEYKEECTTYATGVVNSIHILLGSLPTSHIDMDVVGLHIVEAILAQISVQLARAPAMPGDVEVEILTSLCPIDEGYVENLNEEWIRVLGNVIVSWPRRSVRIERSS